jgi:hypothetical protein
MFSVPTAWAAGDTVLSRDWSPVCGDQLALYQAILPEFEEYGAQLSGSGRWRRCTGVRARAHVRCSPTSSRRAGRDAYRRDGFASVHSCPAEGIRWQSSSAGVNPSGRILSALDDLARPAVSERTMMMRRTWRRFPSQHDHIAVRWMHRWCSSSTATTVSALRPRGVVKEIQHLSVATSRVFGTSRSGAHPHAVRASSRGLV